MTKILAKKFSNFVTAKEAEASAKKSKMRTDFSNLQVCIKTFHGNFDSLCKVLWISYCVSYFEFF